ncbi:MAG: ribose 5-phosphate isomerase B [Eubacteriales bacterium]
MKKRIAIGCDHGGYELKLPILAYLKEEGYQILDMGCDSTDSVNYPVYADKVCNAITDGKADMGILICGTGIGMSMAANKHKGIRAAACENTYSARMTRAHNDANVLCLGARVIGAGLAIDMVELFLHTDFLGGRHSIRVDMLNDLDAN